jgi:hypothetical protein
LRYFEHVTPIKKEKRILDCAASTTWRIYTAAPFIAVKGRRATFTKEGDCVAIGFKYSRFFNCIVENPIALVDNRP